MLADTPFTLTGPFRAPRQMLADQTYGGHASVHDDESAARLGLAGAPIEGPTHFSQFEPLLASLWGEQWFSHGCLSSHFLNMVVEGEEVQASLSGAGPGVDHVQLGAVKSDGTPVLTGTASITGSSSLDVLSGGTADTELADRLQRASANPPTELHILDQLSVGQKGQTADTVNVAFDQHYGDLYPFTLAQKLDGITETVAWFTTEAGPSSPWGAPVVPIEMLSVLTGSGSRHSGFVARQPSLGLFVDLEVQLLGRPVLVGHEYRVEREIVAMAESRRTESYWTSSTLVDVDDNQPTANVLLHQGVFKDSYPDYPS